MHSKLPLMRIVCYQRGMPDRVLPANAAFQRSSNVRRRHGMSGITNERGFPLFS